jgi:endonuclease YncB( thermonuclease family)
VRSLISWVLLIALAAAIALARSSSVEASGDTFICSNPVVVDGDTLRCGERRVRLAGIDAPELPGHCRVGRQCVPGDPFASRENLSRLTRGGAVTCRQTDIDGYGRTVARCSAGNVDLSCAQLNDGAALPRYGAISC